MKHGRRKKLLNRIKAIAIAKVLKEKGYIDLQAAASLVYPNWGKKTLQVHGWEILSGEVMDELAKVLEIRDKDLMKKLKPEVIVQDMLEDLKVLMELQEAHKTDPETIIKILNAKGVKHKLIGMAIGMWKAEQPNERTKTASELLQVLNARSIN